MLDGAVVADAVVHPYNLAPANQDTRAEAQLEAVYGAHVLATGEDHPEHVLTREEFFSDFSFQAMARALFVESDVDFAVLHALPNLGFAKDYVTDPRRAAALRDLHPGRFKLYATVDTPVVDDAVKQLEWQVRELGVDGLKLYPAFFYDGVGAGWRMDGGEFATPLLQAAHDLGIRRVAVHKALWLPPAPRSAFDVDDLAGALERFSDMTFFMVHAGAAFLEQTCELLKAHPNFHATLESTFAFAVVKPQVFAKVLGTLLRECGSSQLLFGSGTNLSHPAPLLDAFRGYQLPDALREEHGFPQVTTEDRAAIMGGNTLRLHGLQAADVLRANAGDVFDRERDAGGAAPWSGIRTPVGAGS